MKDQYAGDQNDYVKLGLLRALCGSELRPLVAWMLTPDDDRRDGRRRGYLDDARWRRHDPDLHDALKRVPNHPTVASLEPALRIPGAAFLRDNIPDAGGERAEWSRKQLTASKGFDLVFFDPDNGFEVRSKPMGRRGSCKYVAWSEVEATYRNGQSVLVYQHFRRVPRDQLALDLIAEVSRRTDCPSAVAFRTAHVLFVLGIAANHSEVVERGIAGVETRWAGRITVQRPS